MRRAAIALAILTACYDYPDAPDAFAVPHPQREGWAGEACESLFAVCHGPYDGWYRGVCVPRVEGGVQLGSCWPPCRDYVGSEWTCPAGMEADIYRSAPGEYGFCACVDP